VRDEHNHPEKLSHTEQCSNPYQTHTDNSLGKTFEPKFIKLFCAHSCKQSNFYFVGENKYDMHRKFKWRYKIKGFACRYHYNTCWYFCRHMWKIWYSCCTLLMFLTYFSTSPEMSLPTFIVLFPRSMEKQWIEVSLYTVSRQGSKGEWI
jgi:hypothetical protein